MEPPRGEPAHADAAGEPGDAAVAAQRDELAPVVVAELARRPPLVEATTLRASCFAWRMACCAVGGHSPPVVRSGTAALSPAAQAPGTTPPSASWTRRYSSQVTRPRSSTGKPERAASGCGRTPVVHTSVVAGNSSPLDSRMIPPSADSRLVSQADSIPRRVKRRSGVLGEALVDLGEEAIRGLDQHPPGALAAELGVALRARRG